SMVEFADGCVMAQMSYPTMELPIQLALTYPERFDCGLKSLDFEKLAQIRFLPLTRKDFPCYDLALSSIEAGDNYPCALNGAGEVAVHAFLRGEIAFTDIQKAIEYALKKTERTKIDGYAVACETDARARALAAEWIKTKKVGRN
ncbi:MAG: 1-deoxy-D-xylulose-5-phosphate reductoisomerase, partial [Clostridia bacterium]|nr:1-deoxy-D-xylulose-5-phosphate reductoisomerase [Clostridia bacterium]